MLALTIREPFVFEIFEGIKVMEYRTWPTDHRGPLAIHASVSKASLVKGWRNIVIDDDGTKASERFVFGVLVGFVDVTGCTWDAEAGCYAWHLANPRRLAMP